LHVQRSGKSGGIAWETPGWDSRESLVVGVLSTAHQPTTTTTPPTPPGFSTKTQGFSSARPGNSSMSGPDWTLRRTYVAETDTDTDTEF